ncbi:MAG: hypothetical protein NMNS01_03860 [Nitrosomonas sp.]|nr:MAG: hypothetical protein NMNS01_03860 [Nitrosomonas sp.]
MKLISGIIHPFPVPHQASIDASGVIQVVEEKVSYAKNGLYFVKASPEKIAFPNNAFMTVQLRIPAARYLMEKSIAMHCVARYPEK